MCVSLHLPLLAIVLLGCGKSWCWFAVPPAPHAPQGENPGPAPLQQDLSLVSSTETRPLRPPVIRWKAGHAGDRMAFTTHGQLRLPGILMGPPCMRRPRPPAAAPSNPPAQRCQSVAPSPPTAPSGPHNPTSVAIAIAIGLRARARTCVNAVLFSVGGPSLPPSWRAARKPLPYPTTQHCIALVLCPNRSGLGVWQQREVPDRIKREEPTTLNEESIP